MTIHEPMTLATDYLIAVVAVTLGTILHRRDARSWPAAFFAIAAGALLGGTYHGFVHVMTPLAAAILWRATVYAIGFATLFLFFGVSGDLIRNRRLRLTIEIFALVEFVVYMAWISFRPDFLYVILDYGSALLLIGGAAIASWKRLPEAGWFVASVVTSVVAAVVQQSGIALHRHFNHNDLYHVIQIAALWLLYRGIANLRTRSIAQSTIPPM